MLECVNRRNEKFARKFLHILIVLICNTSTIRVIDFFLINRVNSKTLPVQPR